MIVGKPGVGRHDVALLCHPDAPNRRVRSVSARVVVDRSGSLAFAFRLDADLTRLRVPAAMPPRRADRLWEHTCFEAFVTVRGQAAYREFNFSPSGEWAAYAFCGYRDGAVLARDPAPAIAVRRAADALELEALVGAGCLPSTAKGARLQVALTAVIEDDVGALSYWAIRHPGVRPDFHHRDGFALEFDAPHNPDMEPPRLREDE